MCEQHRLRPACAYAQSDQSLCKSLGYSMSVKLLTKHHLELLSLKGGCPGSSESTHVKMPHCWKSHALAHLFQMSGDLAKQRTLCKWTLDKGLKQSILDGTIFPSLEADCLFKRFRGSFTKWFSLIARIGSNLPLCIVYGAFCRFKPKTSCISREKDLQFFWTRTRIYNLVSYFHATTSLTKT